MKLFIKIILAVIFSATIGHAQLGINTTNPQAIFHVDGANDNPEAGSTNAEQEANDVVINNTGNMGIGTITPTAKLDVVGSTNLVPLRVQQMPVTASNSRLFSNSTLKPVLIDNNGVLVIQNVPTTTPGSYSVDNGFIVATAPAATNLFTGISGRSIVTFRFNTNLGASTENPFLIYGQISYSTRRGFRVSSDWSASGPASAGNVTLTGEGTNRLTFNIGTGRSAGALTFSFSGSTISISRNSIVTGNFIMIYEGMKIR